MPENILDQILKTKEEEMKVFRMPEKGPSMLHHSLRHALSHPKHELGLIAEVKQASPSKGIFKEKIEPVEIAAAYKEANADAISVLTDRTYFRGSIDNLVEIKRAVDLPLLRKDFIIDERQIEEAARVGADAILLIAAALEPHRLHELYLAAQARGLEALVEVHRIEEADGILNLFTPEIMGANNRDLQTFKTDIHLTASIRKMIPDNVLFVSESGIHSATDVRYLKKLGVSAALVGEALICAASVQEKIRSMFGEEVSENASQA